MSTAPDIDPEHRYDCPGARLGTFVGRHGDTITRCASCGRITVHPSTEPVHAPEDEPNEPDEPSRPVGRYVCRDHHDQPVNARGKGCRKCTRRRDPERTETP